MDERRKINLHKHTLPPVSNKYLIKIIIYVVLFVIVGALVYQVGIRLKPKNQNINDVEIINNVELDVTPSRN